MGCVLGSMYLPPRGEFWLLIASTLLFNCGISIILFLYNLYLLDLGLGEQPMGTQTSAMVLGGMVGTLPMGWLASRYGLKRVLAGSLGLTGTAFAVRVCMLWMPAQTLISFLAGVFLCGWMVCLSPALAAIVEQDKRPRAFSLLYGCALAAGSAAAVLGGGIPVFCQRMFAHVVGLVLTDAEAKRAALLLGCALVSLAALPVMKLEFTEASESAVAEERDSWRHCLSPFLLRFLVVSACWSAAVGAFNPFAGVFFTRSLAFPLPRLGLFFCLAQLVQAGALLLLSSWTMRRLGTAASVLAAQLVTAAAMGCMAWSHSVLSAEMLYCVFMIAQQMTQPGMQVLLMDNAPAKSRSQSAAMNFLVVSIAQAFAASLAGWALGRCGYPQVMAGIALAVLCSALLFRFLFKDPQESLALASD